MAQTAAKKLMTSKGTIAVGEYLPAGLPAAELKALRDAGGIAGVTADAPKTRGKKGGDGNAEARQNAERAVKDAEALVAQAESEEDKEKAEALLRDAQASLDLLD